MWSNTSCILSSSRYSSRLTCYKRRTGCWKLPNIFNNKKIYTKNKSDILCCGFILKGDFNTFVIRWSSCFMNWLPASEVFKDTLLSVWASFTNLFIFPINSCVYILCHDFTDLFIWATFPFFTVNPFCTVPSLSLPFSYTGIFTGSLWFLFLSSLPGLLIQYFQTASRLLADFLFFWVFILWVFLLITSFLCNSLFWNRTSVYGIYLACSLPLQY